MKYLVLGSFYSANALAGMVDKSAWITKDPLVGPMDWENGWMFPMDSMKTDGNHENQLITSFDNQILPRFANAGPHIVKT
jgi:hypothetical protein